MHGMIHDVFSRGVSVWNVCVFSVDSTQSLGYDASEKKKEFLLVQEFSALWLGIKFLFRGH